MRKGKKMVTVLSVLCHSGCGTFVGQPSVCLDGSDSI